MKDDEDFILGGTIGPDIPNIVIFDRATGNEICCQSRSDKNKSIETTFRIEYEARNYAHGKRGPVYAGY